MTAPITVTPAVEEPVEKTKKKKKRKYSKGLKRIQQVEKGLSRAAKRVASATVEGTKTWEKARDKSARKKKDGGFKDALTNGIRASAKSAFVASRASLDLFEAAKPL